MRIVCQKCSAAYAIDDKFITAKGVRAQCPRCRHLQLVKKDDAAPSEIAEIKSPEARAAVQAAAAAAAANGAAPAPAAGGPAASAFLFDLEAAPPPPPTKSAPPPPAAAAPPPPSPFAPSSNVGTELDFGEFDLGAPPPAPAAAPAPAAPPPPAPFAGPPPAEFEASFDAGPPSPGADASEMDFSGLAPPEEPPAEAARPTQEIASAGIKCRTCGKALTDPFDQAIGVCDDCRSQVDGAAAGSDSANTATVGPPSSPGVPNPKPSGPKVSAAPAVPIGAAAAPRRVSASIPASDDDDGGGKSKVAMVVVGLLLVGGIGTVLAIKKPWRSKPPPLAQKLSAGADKPIERAIEKWRLQYLDLAGSSADHLAAGEEQLAKDTGSGYLEAEEEFQKALVLDKSSDRAIAGWVLAMAFGRGSGIDDEMAKVAEELLVAAEQRGGAGRVYTAHAHLLLARNGNMNDIKVMAERGKNSPSGRDQALALLALGQAMISKNPQYAAESFAQALKLDPKLKRAYLAQSQLLLSLGRYREAMTNIEKQLDLGADQWEAADALARTWIEVGEVPKAKKVYDAAYKADPRNFRARLALAVLAYQHENNPDGALAQLDAIVADKDKIEVKDLVEALGHRAAVQRISGELAASIASAEEAISLKALDPHVNLQRFLVGIEQGNAGEARAQWPFIKGKLGDANLEKTLEGTLVLLEGKPNEAMKVFFAAYEADNRRIDALLLAGASAAKAKNESKAWELVLKNGLKADPRYGGPLPVMARFYVRPQDLLRQAKGAFEPLATEPDDPNVPMAEGLIAWYSNDFQAAEKHFTRAVAVDPGNGHGLAYKALLALRRKENANALSLAKKAVAAEREFALGHYAVGAALLATNQFETAKAPFRTAFELEPKFAAARVKLAEVEHKQKKPEEARKILAAVLLVDPLYFDAKKALYALP